MKTSKRDKTKALKKYIEKTYRDMMVWYPETCYWSIDYSDRELNDSNGIMSIVMNFTCMTMSLIVYKGAFKKTRTYIRHIIAHEIGHIFTQQLSILVTMKYVSEEQHSLIDEQSATRVGFLLEKLTEKHKKPNKPKKKKVDK